MGSPPLRTRALSGYLAGAQLLADAIARLGEVHEHLTGTPSPLDHLDRESIEAFQKAREVAEGG